MTPCRLIYRSTAKADSLNERTLVDIQNRAENNNRRLGIYGLLLLSGNQFLQVLEGTPKFINQIYSNVIRDSRHFNVNLISYEGIVAPQFVEWDMKLVQLTSLNPDLQKFFTEKYPTDNNRLLFNDDAFLMSALLVDMRYALSNIE